MQQRQRYVFDLPDLSRMEGLNVCELLRIRGRGTVQPHARYVLDLRGRIKRK